MSGDTYDVQGEVRDALSTAVNSYGKRVLSDPRVLGNLVADLLPDNPRERSLLVAAAEAGIAGELTQNVEGQHMDAETAVALAAQSLTDNRSLDRAASMWVATEYAKALGYQVQSQALPPVDSAPVAPQAPGHDPTMLANEPVSPWTPAPAASPWGQPGPTSTPDPAPSPWGPTSAPSPWGPTSAPSPAPSPWGPTSAPSPGADQDANGWAPTSTSNPAVNANGWAPTPTSNPSPSPWAQSPASNPSSSPSSNPAPAADPWASPSPAPSSPWSPTPPPPPGGQGPWPAAAPAPGRSSPRGLFLGGGTAVAILVVYVAIAAVAQVFPFSKSSANPTPAPTLSSPAPRPSTSGSGIAGSPTPTGSGTATGTAGLAPLAAGVKPVKVLMPYDISDANTECSEQEKIPWTNPGLVKALECTAPDMPDGQIFGYQLDSTADYQKAWANYNSWAEFGTSKTLDCPPTGSNTQGGPTKWWGPRFPKKSGQVIECFTSDSGPVYIWSYPTEDTFMVAQPAKSWAFSKLETWWENNAV